MTAEKLIAIITFAITNGASLAGRVKAFADLLHPGHGLTNEQINDLELAAQDDDKKRIADRTPPAGDEVA